jgi:hypothetical protein
MTPADQIRNDTRTTRLLLNVLTARLGPTLQALEAQADAIDGYPTIASGSDTGPHSNDTTSSVERAVINRIEHDPAGRWDRRPVAALHEGADLTRSLLHIARQLLDWCDTHSGSRLSASELDTLRCTNWRKDDPKSCGNFATPRRHNNQTIDDKRCLGCGQLVDDIEDERQAHRFQRAQNARDRYHHPEKIGGRDNGR